MLKRNINLDRYKSYYDKNGIKYANIDGNIFCEYNKMIVPIGPINQEYNIAEYYTELFDIFPKSIMIRSISGIDESEENEWYAVICDNFIELEKMNSKLRYQVKKGLKNCVVKKISAEFLSKNGYSVFINAFNSYNKMKQPNITRESYCNEILKAKDFEDIIHYWGVFYEEKLVAYAINNIYGTEEVNYSVIKIDPQYLNIYPSYALIYRMNEYYLKEKKIKYVNDGFRSLYHDSNIQEFLIKKFNFRKQKIGLIIKYRWYFSIIIKLTYKFKGILGRIDRRVQAIYRLEDIARKRLT